MPLTFAIADLHGRFDLLTKAYEAIAVRAVNAPITVIHLGDYIDRGPDSRSVVEFLMAPLIVFPQWKRIFLRGNHEEMALMTIDLGMDPSWWIGNGGGATLLSYGHAKSGEFCPSVVPADHIDWMSRLPTTHQDDHRVYVHAAVDDLIELANQSVETLTWHRYGDDDEGGYRGKMVIHGHTPRADGPIVKAGRVNLDTHAYHTGRLVVGVFDDAVPGGPVDTIVITGAPHG